MTKGTEETSAPIIVIPPGWKIVVELESITWDDMKKLTAIAEAMGWLNSEVGFDYIDLDDGNRAPYAITLEDI